VLRGLLSGPLDVDKLDYLPRDARACHVPYGGVDTARLIDALRIAEVEGQRRIVIGAKGVSPLHSLINARQEMFDNVYWHHTNRACMIMLQRAVQEALEARAVAPDQLTTLDDASLTQLLCDESMPATCRYLTGNLRERRIHKRAVEVSARAVELYARLGNLYFDPEARRTAEDALAERMSALLGHPVRPGAILLSIPKPERWRTDVWVQFERPPVGFRQLMPWREVVGLQDDDFKRYEEHRRLIRLLTDAEIRDAVRAHWEELLHPLLGGVF
jgi:HD superfamily phosphohydrolase